MLFKDIKGNFTLGISSLKQSYAYLAIVIIIEHSFQHASISPIIYIKMDWTTSVKKNMIFLVRKLGKTMCAKHQIKKYCITVLDKTKATIQDD